MIDDHHHDNDEDHDLGDVEPTSQEEIDQMVDEIERKHGKVVISKTSEQQQEQKKDNDKGSNKKEGKRPVLAYNYSKHRRISLHEAVIIAGKPTFIKYDANTSQILEVEKIEEEHRVIRPPYEEEYPYQPYEFENILELNRYLETAKHESVFSLYRKAKSIFRKYNDQDDHKLTLLAVDTVWSYFQDKFATTHYDAIIGDNGSGKSTVGDTFEATGYRAINLTDPNATNLFRILGTVEPGQCTIIADESDKIEESAEMMSILKSGYHRSKKVVRTNSNTWMQEYFFPYCFKIIIAERSPSESKARSTRAHIYHSYI
jgi:hypothetical protein